MMWARSAASSVPAAGGGSAAARVRPKASSTCSAGPDERMSARSMTFCQLAEFAGES